jgi:WD40 repeat protein
MSSGSEFTAERALLAAGIQHYDHPSFARLEDVPGSLRTVVDVLAAAGFTPVAADPGYLLDPGREVLRAAVRRAACSAPAVVVYYTGHGADLPGGTFYLVGKASGPGGLLSDAAVAARELLELVVVRDEDSEPLASQPAVLVILDCCYSGSAGMVMVRDALNGAGNARTWVIATAGSTQYAVAGQFARALEQVLAQPLSGPSQEFLSLDSIVGAVNATIAGQAEQVAHLFVPATGSTGVPGFFRNPGYLAGVTGRTVDEQHWLSRAQAGPQETTVGSYLTGVTGRRLAAEHLADWLTGPEPDRLAVVTGSPGTGKSALLSLPVLLSQRARHSDLLRTGSGSLLHHAAGRIPAGLPVAAVHVRGLSTDQAARAIADALGRDPLSAAGLLEDLEASPVTGGQIVVIDAVDEATSPQILLSDLAVPLARQPGLRVVAGIRRHTLPSPAGSGMVIDLDASQYHDPQAVTGYVSQLLTAAAEPGVITTYTRASQDTTQAVAAGIARRAVANAGGAESFLLARLLTLSIRNQPEPALVSADWLAALPTSIADAFDEDLARLGDKQPLARVLLTALAWAKGPGLPWETIWAPTARAVAELGHGGAGPKIGDKGIRWLLAHAGAYIVEDLGPGKRSAYRPFHDLLAAHLCGEPTTEQREADPAAAAAWHERRTRTEAAITRALLGTVPSGPDGKPDWLTAHPYLRTYLAQHAAAAGAEMFASLTRDAGYLAQADPVTLTPLLSPADPDLRETARIYRRALPLLGDNPSANAAHLAEARLAVTGTSTLTENTSVRLLYRTRMASVSQDDCLLTLTGHADTVGSVAFGTAPDGRLLLATGSADGTARVWDPLTGIPLSDPFTGHARAVYSVAFGTAPDGRLLLATGSADGARVWDPLTGTAVRGTVVGDTRQVSSVAFGTTPDGRLLLATGSRNGTVRLWDPLTGARVRRHVTGHASAVSSVAFGTTPDGRLLLASGSEHGVRVWDTFTRSFRRGPLIEFAHTDTVSSMAFSTAADGQLLLATVSEHSARVWKALAGTALGDALTGHTGKLSSVALGTAPGGRLLMATGSYDRTARLWDPLVETSPQSPVSASAISVAFGKGPGGRLLMATGSYDRTARLWDPLAGMLVGRPLTGHVGEVSSVALGAGSDGRLVLATVSEDGAQVWDPLTDMPDGRPSTRHLGGASSVALGTAPDGRLVLVTASKHGAQLWDPLTGTPFTDPFSDPYFEGAERVYSVALGTAPDGRLLLATGDRLGARVWEAPAGTPVYYPYPCTWVAGYPGGAHLVALGAAPDGRLLLATSGRYGVLVWDALAGTLVGDIIRHAGGVSSIAFGTAPDGRVLLATGGYDRTVQLWEPRRTLNLLVVPRRSSVNAIAMAGPLLAIVDDEGVSVIEPALRPARSISWPRPTGRRWRRRRRDGGQAAR